MGFVFDPKKLADLVDDESRIRAELRELSVSLNDMVESDQWDEKRNSKYQRLSMDHLRLESSLRTASDRRERYENFEPENAKRKAKTVFSRWLRDGSDGLEDGEMKILQDGMEAWGGSQAPRGGSGGESYIINMASRSDDSSGEEAVQEEIPPRVIDRLAYFGGVSAMSQQFFTGTGGEYRIMQEDESTVEGEILGAQNTAVSSKDLGEIEVQTFGAKTGSSKPIILTRELIQDAVFDIQRYVERQAVRRLGRVWNRFFTFTQTGDGMPVGVVSAAKSGITAASATAFTWPELTRLIYGINRAYREGGEMGEGGFMAEMGGVTGYMISDGGELACRLLTDGDNRPLWVPSIRDGVPGTLNGQPYVVNGHMEAPAAGKVPLIYGNFSYYGIRTVRQSRSSDSRIPGRCREIPRNAWPSRAGMDARWAQSYRIPTVS